MSVSVCLSVSDYLCAKADIGIPSVIVFMCCFIHAHVCPLQVDGVNIQSYTNQQAVELLRHTSQTVHLKLVRHDFTPEDTLLPIMPVSTEAKPRQECAYIDNMHGNRNIN